MNKTISTASALIAFFLCFTLLSQPAWSDDSPAKNANFDFPSSYLLDQIKGTVLILPKGAAKPETAEEEQTVQTGDKVITQKDSEATLTLNGVSELQLSADSEVEVGDLSIKDPKDFISRLKLTAGRILAQVAKMGSSHSVFEIEAGGVVCGVRGTVFEVQKDSASAQNTTYEGLVEMDKKDQSQRVAAGLHSDYDMGQGLFRLLRPLNDKEKGRYENWKKNRDLVDKRQKERLEAWKAFNNQSGNDKGQLMEKLQPIRERDRFRLLRRIMLEKNLHDRLQAVDEAVHKRPELLDKREDQRHHEMESSKPKKKHHLPPEESPKNP